jgi:5'-AMP-activated protein kinase catalytic alpha subunit
MIDVLSYISEKGAVHRNLKLENIFVDNNLNIKLFDFGYASINNIDRLKNQRGTLPYMAPEILEQKKAYDGIKADIFSCGVILFILMQGIFPFNQATSADPYYNQI